MTDLASFVHEELHGLHDQELRIAANAVRRVLDSLDPLPVREPEIVPLQPMDRREAFEYGMKPIGFGMYADSLYCGCCEQSVVDAAAIEAIELEMEREHDSD